MFPDVKGRNNDIIIDEQLLRKMQIKKKQVLIEQDRLQCEKRKSTRQLLQIRRSLEKLHTVKNTKNIWIVKPGENTNRGVGISVQTKINDIKQIVNSESSQSNHTFIL